MNAKFGINIKIWSEKVVSYPRLKQTFFY